MGILSFEKPKKIRSTEEHNKMHSSDSGVAGTFVPNMAEDDLYRWKGRHIKGEDERIEIRKSFIGAQCLIVVFKKEYNPPYPEYPNVSYSNPKYFSEIKVYEDRMKEWHKRHGIIQISSNGKINMTSEELNEFQIVIKEAQDLLKDR